MLPGCPHVYPHPKQAETSYIKMLRTFSSLGQNNICRVKQVVELYVVIPPPRTVVVFPTPENMSRKNHSLTCILFQTIFLISILMGSGRHLNFKNCCFLFHLSSSSKFGIHSKFCTCLFYSNRVMTCKAYCTPNLTVHS